MYGTHKCQKLCFYLLLSPVTNSRTHELLHFLFCLLQGRSVNSYFLPNFKNFRKKKKILPYVMLCIVDHTPGVFSLLWSLMRKPHPMQSCLVTSESKKEKHNVEKHRLRPLLPPSLLLIVSLLATWVLYTYATSVLMNFWLQYCCSYSEKLYTSKSYHLAYNGYSKLIIIYHAVHVNL